MLVVARPSGMMESHPSPSGLFLQLKSHARAEPIAVGDGHLELEFDVGNASGDDGSPVEFRSEPEFVLASFDGPAGRFLRPPGVEPGWSAHRFKDPRLRRIDRKVLKDVGQHAIAAAEVR